MNQETRHISVLLNEAISALKAERGGNFLDCTLGGGGHSKAILDVNSSNTVVAADRDLRAIERAQQKFVSYQGRFSALHGTFSSLEAELQGSQFDGILADLGTSMDQLKEGRGFSFSDHADLDMRMDESEGETAADLVNNYSEQDLYVVFRQGGVGPEARGIAQAIIRARPINFSDELAAVVNKALQGRYREKKGNPATLVFQAIRIAVNKELSEIEALLRAAPKLARTNTRFAVITFHSLEDKLVTNMMRRWSSGGDFSAVNPTSRGEARLGRYIARESVQPSKEEISSNPSSRSARLRVFEFAENFNGI